jgi:hypothetical protein
MKYFLFKNDGFDLKNRKKIKENELYLQMRL